MGRRRSGKNIAQPFTGYVLKQHVEMMRDMSGQDTLSKGLRIASNLYKIAVQEKVASFDENLIQYSRLFESFLAYCGGRIAGVLDYMDDIDCIARRREILSGLDSLIESGFQEEKAVNHACWSPVAMKQKDKARLSVRLKPDMQLLYSEIGESMQAGIVKVLSFYNDAVYRHVKGLRDRRLYVCYQVCQDDIIYQLSDKLADYLKKNEGHNPAILTDRLCSAVDMLVDKYKI